MKHLPLALLLATIFLHTACQKNFDQRCVQEAKEYTQKHCPKQLEPGNTLDSITYDIETRTYQYHYSISGKLDTRSSINYIVLHKETLKVDLLKALNNSIELNACKKEGINFSYKYYSATTKKEFLNIILTPADYRKIN